MNHVAKHLGKQWCLERDSIHTRSSSLPKSLHWMLTIWSCVKIQILIEQRFLERKMAYEINTICISSVGQIDEENYRRNTKIHGPPWIGFRFWRCAAIRGDSVVSLTTPVVGQSCRVSSILVRVRTYLKCRLTISHVANIRIIYYTISLCKLLYYSIACTVIVIHTIYYVSNRQTRRDSTYQKFNILWVTDSQKRRTTTTTTTG